MMESGQISPVSDHGMLFPGLFFSKGEKTFQYDESLPPLPVPSLQQTLVKYLQSVKPLVSDDEYTNTVKIVEEFAYGQGSELHAKLLEKAKHSKNWLSQWWEDYAYLSFREPHNPLVSFSGPGPYIFQSWLPEQGSQIWRSAYVIWCTVKYWQLLYKQKLVVDRAGLKEKNVWSMSQFKRMFNTCKIPGEKLDSFKFFFKTEDEGPPLTNLLIFCQGRIFYFDVTDSKGEPITIPEIQHQLIQIQQSCDGKPWGPGLGALTGGNRTDFYRAREHLLSLDPTNRSNMDIIEQAMFAFALDDAEPTTITELCREGLVGNSRNRWFDKSMTHISFKNGTISCNCDHAPHDAMIMVSSSLWNLLVIQMNNSEWKGPKEIRSLPAPRELVFKLDAQLNLYIDKALQVFKKAGDSFEIFSDIYTGYGRRYLRQMKVHPDTHCQVALQYAYYRIYGKPASTYETASTRKYYNARTETLRSSTTEALEFAKAMLIENTTKKEQLMKLKAAYDKHNQMMVECQNAMGIDRHLFGMQCIAMEEGLPMPKLYNDPSYTKSGGGGNFTLSTSFVGYTDVYGGVAPMCRNGYGQFYAIQPDTISYFISSWVADTTTNSKMLYDTIVKCLDDMKALLDYAKMATPTDTAKL